MPDLHDRDVYSGDNRFNEGTGGNEPGRSYSYQIVAVADPDVLLRTASQLLLANCAPYRLALTPANDDSVIIDAELRDISELIAESIRRKLLQLTCVSSVRMSRSRTSDTQWPTGPNPSP